VKFQRLTIGEVFKTNSFSLFGYNWNRTFVEYQYISALSKYTAWLLRTYVFVLQMISLFVLRKQISVANLILSILLSNHTRNKWQRKCILNETNLAYFQTVYSIAVTRHVLTKRSKGQRSRSHGYENRHGRTVVSDHDRYCV